MLAESKVIKAMLHHPVHAFELVSNPGKWALEATEPWEHAHGSFFILVIIEVPCSASVPEESIINRSLPHRQIVIRNLGNDHYLSLILDRLATSY